MNPNLTALPTVPFSPMEPVFQLVRQVLFHRTTSRFLPEDRSTIAKMLLEIRGHHRLYLINKTIQLDEVWDIVRRSTVLMDTLLECTIDLHLRLAGTALPFETLCERLADAYSATRGLAAEENCSIDDDLFDRLGEKQQLLSLYRANSWFVFLLLLDSIDAAAILRATMTETGDGSA